MANAAVKLHIVNRVLDGTKCLGNTKTDLVDIASRLIEDAVKRGEKIGDIAARCYLSSITVERVRTLEECESGAPYRPSADTVQRVLRAFGAEITMGQVRIQRRFDNQPKAEL